MDGDTGFSNLVCLESLILGRNRSCAGSVKTQSPADVKPLAFIEGKLLSNCGNGGVVTSRRLQPRALAKAFASATRRNPASRIGIFEGRIALGWSRTPLRREARSFHTER